MGQNSKNATKNDPKTQKCRKTQGKPKNRMNNLREAFSQTQIVREMESKVNHLKNYKKTLEKHTFSYQT